jgi:hypothetical protein
MPNVFDKATAIKPGITIRFWYVSSSGTFWWVDRTFPNHDAADQFELRAGADPSFLRLERRPIDVAFETAHGLVDLGTLDLWERRKRDDQKRDRRRKRAARNIQRAAHRARGKALRMRGSGAIPRVPLRLCVAPATTDDPSPRPSFTHPGG